MKKIFKSVKRTLSIRTSAYSFPHYWYLYHNL